METINIQGHNIETDEYGEVVCPWPNKKGPKGARILGNRAITYRCKCGHVHGLKDFPTLQTNDIKDNQIHTR